MPAADQRLLVPALVVAAGALLVVRLARDSSVKPVHEDEALSGLISARPLPQALEMVMEDRGGAPLHYVLAHFALAGDPSVVALRSLSVVFAAGAVLLCFDLARRLSGPVAGVTAALVASFSQLLMIYGSVGRMYALFAFTAALAADLFVVANERRTARWTAAAAGAAWLLAASHAYGFFVVGGEAVVAAALWRGRPLRAIWPVALVSVFFVPLIASYAQLVQRFDAGREGAAPLATPEQAARLFVHALGGLAGGRGPVFLLFVALTVLGAAALQRQHRAFVALAAVALLAAPALLVLGRGDTVTSDRLEPRHLIYGLPFWTALVAAGVARLLTGRPPVVAGLGVAVVAAAAFLAPAAIRDPRDLDSGTAAATAAPADRLVQELDSGSILFPSSPVYLAALPAARHALPISRGQPALVRATIGRAHLPVDTVHLAVPLDFATNVNVPAIERELGSAYKVEAFDSWLLITARGPFTDHAAVAEAAARGMSAAKASITTRSVRLEAYFRQSLRSLCGAARQLEGECTFVP